MTEHWFALGNRPGHRTLEQQLTGLELMLERIPGKTVLDMGCAEGLIAFECHARGAARVHGVELRKSAIRYAKNRAIHMRRIAFDIGNADAWRPVKPYDVVLLLAILQKLNDPGRTFARMLVACRELCVLRLPQRAWPVLTMRKPDPIEYPLAAIAKAQQFELVHVADGPTIGDAPPEWIGYFERIKR